jgi:hypothetical protein
MSAVEQVFLEALDDLRSGRSEPVERYLERVPATDRQQLADLLAGYFASRVRPVDPHANAALFERTLEVVDRVIGERSGEAGLLPAMLVQLSSTRGLRRRDLVARLREQLGLPERAETTLAEYYHRLESNRVPGPSLSRRLLVALGSVLRISEEELDAASRPFCPPTRVQAVAGFGRGATLGAEISGTAPAVPAVPEDPVAHEVYSLFYGGRDA